MAADTKRISGHGDARARTKRFRAVLQKDDKTEGTGIAMPFDMYKVFGTRGRVPVRGTLNGFVFRSTLAPMGGGVHFLPVSRALRDGAKAKAGDMVEVALERDEAPRIIAPPPDFARALKVNKAAQAAWDTLSPSHRREYVGAFEEAKKAETRARRIETTVAELARSGRPPARPASTKPVAQKLQRKEGQRILLVNAPKGYTALLGDDLPRGAAIVKAPAQAAAQAADVIQVFVANREELEAQLSGFKAALDPKGALWITYLKGTAKVRTDINRDSIAAYASSLGLEGVALISIDDDWTSLRLKAV